jgi:hypothetical protein
MGTQDFSRLSLNPSAAVADGCSPLAWHAAATHSSSTLRAAPESKPDQEMQLATGSHVWVARPSGWVRGVVSKATPEQLQVALQDGTVVETPASACELQNADVCEEVGLLTGIRIGSGLLVLCLSCCGPSPRAGAASSRSTICSDAVVLVRLLDLDYSLSELTGRRMAPT